jgi:hypothetical protein
MGTAPQRVDEEASRRQAIFCDGLADQGMGSKAHFFLVGLCLWAALWMVLSYFQDSIPAFVAVSFLGRDTGLRSRAVAGG